MTDHDLLDFAFVWLYERGEEIPEFLYKMQESIYIKGKLNSKESAKLRKMFHAKKKENEND